MNLLIENCELSFQPKGPDDVGRYADDVGIKSWDKDDILERLNIKYNMFQEIAVKVNLSKTENVVEFQ